MKTFGLTDTIIDPVQSRTDVPFEPNREKKVRT
jgi:hypothetical protein